MEKINVAEILKDCPKGMELDCTMLDNMVFEKIEFSSPKYPVVIRNLKTNTTIGLTEYGQYIDIEEGKCIIFPKSKTTWEGFVPPRKFKDGDALFVDCSEGENMEYRYIFILNNPDFCGKWHSYCHLDGFGYFHSKETYLTDEEYHPRLATEAERQKLFRAMKDNGYKWNTEKKSLEKLIEPKFKVGDKIKSKENRNYIYTITGIREKENKYECGVTFVLRFSEQDNWELVPNKFDITNLVPFESRVLVRDSDNGSWCPSFFGYCKINNCLNCLTYNTIRGFYRQCIPYEGNEHLLGTTNDCDEYYKTWEERA